MFWTFAAILGGIFGPPKGESNDPLAGIRTPDPGWETRMKYLDAHPTQTSQWFRRTCDKGVLSMIWFLVFGPSKKQEAEMKVAFAVDHKEFKLYRMTHDY